MPLIKPVLDHVMGAPLEHVLWLRRRQSFSGSSSSDSTPKMSDQDHDPIEVNLTPDEANRIIHTHRKVRYGEFMGKISLCEGYPMNPEHTD